MSMQVAARPVHTGRAAPVPAEVASPSEVALRPDVTFPAGVALHPGVALHQHDDGAPGLSASASPWAGEPSRAWGRAASIAALGALALHALLALWHAHEAWFALAVLGMGLACAVCSVRCLARPCRRELTALLVMSAAMIMVHVGWLLASGAGGAHHGAALGGGHTASGMGLSMLGLSGAEVLVAALCAVALRRRESITE